MEPYQPPKPPANPATPYSKLPDDVNLNQASMVNERQTHPEYQRHLPPSPSKSKKLLWLSLILIVIALLGSGAYWYLQQHQAKKPVPVQTAVSTEVKPSDQPASITISHYISKGSDLNLSFDYPSNWTATPVSGDNASDQTITVNSPLTTITGADGKSVTGKVTVSLRPVTAGLIELSNGTATSAQASVQFAYSKPTTSQFQYPYLIFIHLVAGPNPNSAFEELLISGTTKFAKAQGISDTSVTVDPIITASFYSCKTTSCVGSDAVRLSITNDTWLNAAIFQQTLAIFKSLQLN